jgi:alkylation response protein AidB-like acyl-CoA dehydrogenase
MHELTEEQRVIAATARDFAREHLAPHAIEWDRGKRFPVDVLRKAAELGLGGVVILEDVRVPGDRLLGGLGRGFRIAMNGLNGGRLGIAACSLGGAETTLRRATAYLAAREAFGAPLLTAQGLQFRLVARGLAEAA